MTGLLQDKVVVVSGVGPGLGRSIALRSAGAGADLVLVARTRSTLEEVAKEVIALGRRAITVQADLTDHSSAENVVAQACQAYGRIDVLVNNAFHMPSMVDFAHTDHQHIRDSIELSVIGSLRMSQLCTPALSATQGSIVMVNSMVLRHSDPTYGSYKIAKSALLSMAQSLSSEIGPHGIRVNSVAPGYIWADTLKGYFAAVAAEQNSTVEQVYQTTAANTDLRRLPEPDQIADSIVFLASDHAAAITGQCLDVNCGEYHH
ncbi:SDR family oxidoreductase [Nocardia cyriacigeorgica]|uniref:SDR family oxidoreductase n=1 Tax=Nocardia cyriacigeorgica TaxID=135487 RepID=A0A6P1DDG4_9NOCA|nr:SDR family oxidoreductase [Nocardia cyriacigeorgica]NEW39871.1 SDR family oxidoreductase [Nocardia cyriacigeorgica]NEW47194.1 SDR family oxidoreductase [Nocardia cyriacigeorgica]NEW51356.1 SDR family oxidoreductase [Nocardia cyriacigeorgica]NEW55425.1 SDR family oxidoreductase [Nocardia cyriacigeorgica]